MKKGLCLLLCLLGLSAGVAHAQAQPRLGAWLPYWEADAALAEAAALGTQLERAVAFACIFDADGLPLMLPDTQALLTSLIDACAGSDTAVFLSVVNDQEIAPEQYENKSIPLLHQLLDDEASLSAHLEALAGLVDAWSLQGLELDYENFQGDTALWSRYITLVSRVWAMCERDGVRLRVVLPWDAPRYATLPAGPEYSVMCYNLFGYHSGPGPKADIAFLQSTCEFYQPLALNVRMAFATGGFDWQTSGITALTQQQAEAQLAQAGVTPVRDAASGALSATYAADGQTHTLWYADGQTLAVWRDTCAAYGFTGFDLFRLGGNRLSDWQAALGSAQP